MHHLINLYSSSVRQLQWLFPIYSWGLYDIERLIIYSSLYSVLTAWLGFKPGYQTSRWTLLATKWATETVHWPQESIPLSSQEHKIPKFCPESSEWSSDTCKHQDMKINSLWICVYRFLSSKDAKRIWNILGKLCWKLTVKNYFSALPPFNVVFLVLFLHSFLSLMQNI